GRICGLSICSPCWASTIRSACPPLAETRKYRCLRVGGELAESSCEINFPAKPRSPSVCLTRISTSALPAGDVIATSASLFGRTQNMPKFAVGDHVERITDYILEEPAKCPNCRHDVLEKTLVEPA